MDIEKIKQEKPILELLGFSILNIDKPSDWTSFDVVNYIRKIFSEFGIKKCGHLGTLDPNVTGVLPVVIGNSCKIQEYFMHRDKVYIGKMQIHKQITEKKLKEEMKKFLGVIEQLPPRISRVKRVLRKRKVSQFELINYDEKTKIAEFISYVEAGTYIRKLVDDLGKNIGGAHMIELRRKKAGLFSDKDAEFCKIEDVGEAVKDFRENKNEKKLRELLIPAEIITEILPVIEVKPEFLGKLKNGSPIFDEMLVDLDKGKKIIDKKEPFGIIANDNLIEIAKYSDKFEQKSILAKPEAVI
jgi:H/ACA ribonucleoprotein complex subunit 4